MKNFFKKIVIIVLLALFFVLDEVLIYIFGVELFNWNASPVILTVGSLIVFGLNLLLALTVYKVMQKKTTTGLQGMLETKGVILQSYDSKYRVKIRGEIWNALSTDRLSRGDKVVVEKIDGLELFVRKEISP